MLLQTFYCNLVICRSINLNFPNILYFQPLLTDLETSGKCQESLLPWILLGVLLTLNVVAITYGVIRHYRRRYENDENKTTNGPGSFNKYTNPSY